MDYSRLFFLITEAGSFISAFAAIAAGVILFQAMKKFGTGMLASGFKSISIGVFLIALGIIVDAAQTYLLISTDQTLTTIIIIIKEVLFVAGTFVIVSGSRKTLDHLETLTK